MQQTSSHKFTLEKQILLWFFSGTIFP
jgi:hypothetical protein